MKKTIFICAALLLGGMAHAQGFGLQAGFMQSIERYRIGSKNQRQSYDPMNGFKVGLVYEYDFYKGIGLSTGLNYSFVGDKTKWEYEKNTTAGWQNRYKKQAHYIDVPTLLNYRSRVAKDTYIIVYAGPIFSFGLSNKATTERKNVSQSKTSTYDLFASDPVNYNGDYAISKTTPKQDLYDNVQRFNVLMSAGVGFQYQKYQLKGGYDWGLCNLYQNRLAANTFESARLSDRRDEWYLKLVYFF